MENETDQSLEKIHRKALEEFNLAHDAQRDQRELSLSDRRFCFIPGAMWDGAMGEQFDNRIKLEVNKVLLSVTRIFNEYRNNDITVNFIPKDGSEADKLADLCAGLYRADEQDSQANEAMDNAFEEGVSGGFGAWRLCSEYDDPYNDDDDYQRIRFEPIYEADCSVYFDANAKRYDKSDASHAFVITGMTVDAYKEEYDDDPSTWPRPTNGGFDWVTADTVYVAEYYCVKETTEKIYVYREVDGNEIKHRESEFTDNPNLKAELKAKGSRKIREKKVESREVHKYILSGNKVLEDCGRIAGRYIPIVPFYGKRFFIEGSERFMGHVRMARDAQILKNMQISMLAETAAFSGVETPIFTPEQVYGHETTWAEHAVKRKAYLLVNKMTDAAGNETVAGPLDYTRAPSIPPATAALLEISEQDISDILGNQQAGEEVQTQMSGKAVELIQTRLDMQTFIYMDNMSKSVQWCGTVWRDMAKELYADKNRKMKSVGSQGQRKQVVISRSILDENGVAVEENDISRAVLDVAVDVGPASSSRRAATVRGITGIMQLTADPVDQKILSAIALMNMEGEGLNDIREYYRKQLVAQGIGEATDKDKQEMAAQQPAPDQNQIYLQAEAEKAKAQGVLAIAKAQQAEAETAETLANIPINQRDSVVNAVTSLRDAGTASPLNGARGN